jgi:hypothetical protein
MAVSDWLSPKRASSFGKGIRTRLVSLKVDLRSYPRRGQREIESLQTALESAWDGIILTPGSPPESLR